ncbi:MAG: hypothetical protein LBK99_09260 [Opitutaceae bacterium]|jgi:hypothetical protein|nr:hypothetical protein [Opitutaceae bacterium]
MSATFTCRLAVFLLFFLAPLAASLADEALAVHIVAPDEWRTPDPSRVAVTVESSTDPARATARFDIHTPQAGAWTILSGPEISPGARSRFHKNRRFRITLEARTTGLDGYAMQIRIRQRNGEQKTGGSFTRNLSPRREWDAALEMDHAEKYRTWAGLEGDSTAGTGTERLALELWLATPYGKTPVSLALRNVRITEMAEIGHDLTTSVRGNIFFADTGSAKVDFVTPETLRACRVELLDEAQNRIGLVQGEAGTASLTAPLASRGYYTIRAIADYTDGKTITTTTTAAVVGPPLDDATRRHSRFGSMRVWGDRALWEKSGANWDWGIGGINLADYRLNADGTVSPPPSLKPLTYAGTHKNIYTISEFPKWVMPDGYTRSSLMAPKDWTLFERLFETFARQNPDLPWFCPFNEPDAHWRGSKTDFVKFHNAIVRGVKRGNPAMKVLGPGCYSIRMDDFREYEKAGLLDGFEGIVMHGYVNASEPEGKFIENFVELAAFLKETGRGDLPVFITEYGWCAEIGDWQKTITELERSRYAPRSLALLATQPLDDITYFCFKHTSIPGAPGYSLLYMNDTPTPTYVACVNSFKWLSWTQRGDGRWFRFSPKLHLTLFSRDGKNVGVAWNTEGASKLNLPAVATRIEDSMGRPILLTGQPALDVSPAPVYFELPDARALSEAHSLPALSFAPGAAFDLPWQQTPATLVLSAPEITVSGRQAHIAADAGPGDYAIVVKTGDTWREQPVRVLAPLLVGPVDFTLSSDGKQLVAAARVETPIRDGVDVLMTLTLKNGKESTKQLHLAPGLPARIETAIPGFGIGQRFQGKITLALSGQPCFSQEQDFDQTFIPCLSLDYIAADRESIWHTVPGVDFSAWNPSPGPLAASDCSATLKTLVTADAFHLRVDVTDSIHYQSQLPSYMWNGDSIQFAFDVDAGKPWQPNNVGNGYQGHRIFEYGVGLPTRGGSPMVWRWRADAPGFTAGSEEPRIEARVSREGTCTTYDVTLPWAVLGLAKAPPAGSNIGFALVVNDMDGSIDKRRALRIFGGILENKDPNNFGNLHIIETSKTP